MNSKVSTLPMALQTSASLQTKLPQASKPPATARYIRLNILKANGVPAIDEFRVLPPVGANK